jgi:EAL domain-containing protein (putative c-di-GMP-specific phosphodiesterase class I)
MNANAVRRLRLEQRLRQALDAGALTLYFQPKVHAARNGLAGVEALARWFDSEGGPVSPVEFIAIAEESGLIGKLGAWALHCACETLAGWRSRGLDVPHVAVNVSMHQLRDPGFAAFIETTLRKFGLPPQSLEIELTESTLAENPAEIAGHLKRVRALGVRVAIDDFGTGYSSMAVLAQMPVDVLKIDRAFVTDCASHVEAGALLQALVGVAQALGKQVVAEGVETPTQAVFLRSQGCQFMQGYLFGKPMPADELEREFAPSRAVSAGVASFGL